MAIVKPNDFVPSTKAQSAQVDANFDILYNLLSGASTDQDTILRFNSGSLPTLRIDQLGSGPIIVARANLTEMFRVNIDGKTYVPVIMDQNGNEVIVLVGVASAVNEVTVTNAIATARPKISASGGDTNIDLELAGKGTGLIRLPSADPTNNDHAARKLYVDTRRQRWSATFFIQDPSTITSGTFSLIQKANIPGANFVATHVGAIAGTGSDSGAFIVSFRKHPATNQGSVTDLGGVNYNPGLSVLVGAGAEVDIADHAFSANDWVYAYISASAAPQQRDVNAYIRGYVTSENP
jgi:hypothetical protein